jgi:hypothetical protein
MRILGVALPGAVLLAACGTVVVPETSASSASTSSASGSGGSGGGSCIVQLTADVPADTGNADGEGGAGAGSGAPFATDWAASFGDGGPWLTDVAVDGAGDVLLVGGFTTTLDLGSGVTLSDPAGGGFVAKLDAGGNALWAREVSQTTAHVFADKGGGAWITDDGEPPSLTRFDANGTMIWTRPLQYSGTARLVPSSDGGAVVAWSGGNEIFAIDAAGNAVWTTTFDSLFWSMPPTSPANFRTVTVTDMDAAPGGGVTALVQAYEMSISDNSGSCSGSAALLVGVGSTGEVVWKQSLAPASNAVTLTTDAAGNVLLQESLSGSATDDLGHGKFYGGIGLSMFDPTGKPRWGKHFAGGAGALRPVFDAAGNILIAGSFTGNVDFGGGLMDGAGPALRLFVLEVSPHGQWLASRLFASVGPDAQSPYDDGDRAQAMAIAPDGSVLLAGSYTGAIDLGTTPIPDAPSPQVGWVLARIGH